MLRGFTGFTAMAVSLCGLLIPSQSVLTFCAREVGVLQMGLGGFLYCDSPRPLPFSAAGFDELLAKAGLVTMNDTKANIVTRTDSLRRITFPPPVPAFRATQLGSALEQVANPAEDRTSNRS